MSEPLTVEFHRRPSTLAFMARAFYPSPGLRGAAAFPDLRARWAGHRVDGRHLARFRGLTGLRGERGLPLLYPYVLGFPLHMVVLTHPRFPVPIWRVLQVRNHLVRRRHVPETAVLDLETKVGPHRTLDKGIEVDLCTTVTSEGAVAWEGVATFYIRGHFGQPGAPSPLARAPEVADRGGPAVDARWRMPVGPGWAFGGLTGDYNGIHWSDAYARRFGFRRAFHHSQLVLGQCLARLSDTGAWRAEPEAARLDAWLKGPVYYEAQVRLRAQAQAEATTFALVADGEERPAIVGRLSRVEDQRWEVA